MHCRHHCWNSSWARIWSDYQTPKSDIYDEPCMTCMPCMPKTQPLFEAHNLEGGEKGDQREQEGEGCCFDSRTLQGFLLLLFRPGQSRPLEWRAERPSNSPRGADSILMDGRLSSPISKEIRLRTCFSSASSLSSHMGIPRHQPHPQPRHHQRQPQTRQHQRPLRLNQTVWPDFAVHKKRVGLPLSSFPGRVLTHRGPRPHLRHADDFPLISRNLFWVIKGLAVSTHVYVAIPSM